jgi:hypothetical protein
VTVEQGGDGVRRYGGPGAGQVDLEPIVIARSGNLADLRYRVGRERK